MTGEDGEATNHGGAAGPGGGARVSVADNPGGVSIDRLAAELPQEIAELGGSAHWTVSTVAASGATVWHLERDGAPALYLKVAPEAGGATDRLRGEADRVRWFSDLVRRGSLLEAPTVVAAAVDGETGDRYLAITEVAGIPADRPEARGDADALLAALAAGLRSVHELPVESLAFEVTLDDLLARAAQRVAEGLVDPRRFEPIHARYRPEQLLEHLHTLRPPDTADPVVIHGNPRLDNTLVTDGRVSGYVDLGRAGVGDRYLDLAILARELATKVSPHALGPFFAAYGIDAPDVRRLDFFLLLDELL